MNVNSKKEDRMQPQQVYKEYIGEVMRLEVQMMREASLMAEEGCNSEERRVIDNILENGYRHISMLHDLMLSFRDNTE